MVVAETKRYVILFFYLMIHGTHPCSTIRKAYRCHMLKLLDFILDRRLTFDRMLQSLPTRQKPARDVP